MIHTMNSKFAENKKKDYKSWMNHTLETLKDETKMNSTMKRQEGEQGLVENG